MAGRVQGPNALVSVCVISICALGLAACGEARAPARTYEIRGQVLGVDPERREILLKHDAIPGYMSAMTMPFQVSDDTPLDERTRGDLITATLVVADNTAFLRDVARIGFSEAVDEAPAIAASSGFELLREGAEVPDVEFLDQDGQRHPFSAWRGRLVALTFTFTRCPLPTFCPLMDLHFSTIQRSVRDDARLRDQVALVSVSFDPAYDTPEVLRGHAASLDADPAIWTFVTGDRDDIDRFGMRFGLSVMRNQNDPRDISHNLRTVVIDREGRLVSVYRGNEWTPDQILADLTRLADGG